MIAPLRMLALASCLLAARTAIAAPPDDLSSVTSPRDAYQRAVEAWKADEKEAAAHWFARADALAASDMALASALRAAHAAGLPVLAMALAGRAERAGVSDEVSLQAAAARAKFGASVGRVTVRCPRGIACAAELDAAPLPEGGVVSVGEHQVSWVCPSGREIRSVDVAARATLEIEAACSDPAPPPTPAPTAASTAGAPAHPPAPRRASSDGASSTVATQSSGISSTWFWVGVGASVVLGGVSTWSGVDTRAKHDDFVATGRTDADLERDGKAAQTRTNVLFVATGAVVLLTAGVGLFGVEWRSERAQVALTPIPRGAAVGLSAGF